MLTGPLGYYKFDAVTVGQTFSVNVEAKGYSFAPQIVFLTDELTELNFTAEP